MCSTFHLQPFLLMFNFLPSNTASKQRYILNVPPYVVAPDSFQISACVLINPTKIFPLATFLPDTSKPSLHLCRAPPYSPSAAYHPVPPLPPFNLLSCRLTPSRCDIVSTTLSPFLQCLKTVLKCPSEPWRAAMHMICATSWLVLFCCSCCSRACVVPNCQWNVCKLGGAHNISRSKSLRLSPSAPTHFANHEMVNCTFARHTPCSLEPLLCTSLQACRILFHFHTLQLFPLKLLRHGHIRVRDTLFVFCFTHQNSLYFQPSSSTIPLPQQFACMII